MYRVSLRTFPFAVKLVVENQFSMSIPPPRACASFFPASLPYFRDPTQLPAPLPTAAEFQASTRILGDRTAQRTVAVGKHYIVKYGHAVSLAEGRSLLFVEQNLAIPAPKLFPLYKDEELGYVLIMGPVEGETPGEL